MLKFIEKSSLIFLVISLIIVAIILIGKKVTGEIATGILVGPIHKGTSRFDVKVAHPDVAKQAAGGTVRIGKNTYKIKSITNLLGLGRYKNYTDPQIISVSVKGSLDDHASSVPVLFFSPLVKI